MTRLRKTGMAAIFVMVSFIALGPALSASADDSSTTTFAASASQTVSYGTNWVMPVTVAGTQQYDYVVASSGTVNILIKGIPGTYVTGLPLTPGGLAFFSPPSSRPPLGAGTYQVTAVYVPSGTSGLSSSQTLTPATLTVTALRMSTSFAVNKVTVNNKPGLQVVATALAPTDAVIPAGTWHVTAKGPNGTTAFRTVVPLAKDPADPVTVTLTQKVRPGRVYTISARFVPAADVAGGYTVTNGHPQKVTVEPESLGEVLSTPFAAPIWLLSAVALGFILLIAAGIVLLVTGRTTASGLAADSDAAHAESAAETPTPAAPEGS